MADSPRPWHEADPEATGNTFYGLSFKAFKALGHLERLALMAKWDRKRGVKPKYCQSEDKLSSWTALVPRKKRP